MYSQDLPDQWEQFPDSQGYDRQYGFVIFFLFAESLTNSSSLQSSFISSHGYFISQPFQVSTCSTFKQGLSNQNHFTIFHLPVFTTVLEHSQFIPSHKNGDLRINVSQLSTLKHMPRLYPRYKQDQPIPLLSWGLGPRPNLDSKPPHLRPGLGMVFRPPPFPTSNQSVRKEPEPTIRVQRAFPPP